MIKQKKIEKGYTQETLARLVGVTLRHYIQIEQYKNAPSVYTAIKLCKVLDSKIEELFPIAD